MKNQVFQKKNKQNLNLMLNLRQEGLSVRYLATFFGVDRKSIKYQCHKYAIYPQDDGINLFRPIRLLILKNFTPEIKKESVWTYKDGEVINLGKDYKDYLQEMKSR